MRVIKIIFIVLLVIFVIGIIGGVIFVKTFDINRYKPQIITAAKSTLNRKLDFSTIKLDLSLTQGVRVSVKDIALGEHPAFGSDNFLSIEEAYLNVDVLSYLLKKQVSISKILIKTPRVHIIRTQDGAINAQSMGNDMQAPSHSATDNSAPDKPSTPPAAVALPAVFIDSIELENGTVMVVDQTFEAPLSVEISHLNLAVNGFSLSNPFSFTVSGAVFGPEENIRVEGRAQINPQTSLIKLSQVKSDINFKDFSLNQIRELPILPKETPFPEVLEGTLHLLVKELSADDQGLKSITADIKLDEGNISIKEAAPGVSFSASNLNVGFKDFSLSAPFQWTVSASYLSTMPNISAAGKAFINMQTQAINISETQFDTELASFSLKQLKSSMAVLKDIPFPDKLAGKLKLNIKDAGFSAKGLDALMMDVDLSGAQLAMKDIAPGVSFETNQIDLGLRHFSLSEPFEITLKAAYLSAAQNIFFKGKGSLDLNTQSIKITDADMKTDLASLTLAQLKESVAALKEVPFPNELKGNLQVIFKELSAGPLGLTQLKADAKLKDGKIVFHELAPGVDFACSQANITITNFALDDDFGLKGSIAYLSAEPNISFQGTGNFDLKTQQIKLGAFDINTTLSSFSMDQLRQSMAAVKDAPLPKSLKGDAHVSLSSLIAGPSGLMSLNGVTEISNGQVMLNELAKPIDELNAKIKLSESLITIPPSTFRIGEGKISVQGKLENYLTTQDYQIKSSIERLSISEIIDQKDFPIKVQGLVNGNIDLSGRGFDPLKILDTIKSKGIFTITEGKLTDINILKLVLDQLNFVPNVRQTLEENLPARFKEKLKQKDTIVTAVNVDLSVENGAVLLNTMDMEADGFFFKGKGTAGFDQSFSFDGAFIIPQDLALSMAKVINEFELLYDEQGQIQFPLKVSGKGSAVKFNPDIKFITTNAVKNKGRQELQKVLDKVFKTDEPSQENNPESTNPEAPAPANQTSNPDQLPPAQKQKAAEQVLIEGILDTIFKK